uniref:Uncharacterized protein n=1 Tax=viral metagenome TaxID=1070528 RepID=A0A6C0F0Y4_9ZZZZ
MNALFDFDGVLHKHVHPVILEEHKKDYGSRKINITRDEMPTRVFQLNIDRIINYSKLGYNVYIVTARLCKHNVIKCLRSLGITEDIIPNKNVMHRQKSKAFKVTQLQANEYYDDSPHHIIEVQKIRHLLPENFKMFLSVPERNINIEIPADLNLSDSVLKVNVYRVLKFQHDFLSQLARKTPTRNINIELPAKLSIPDSEIKERVLKFQGKFLTNNRATRKNKSIVKKSNCKSMKKI